MQYGVYRNNGNSKAYPYLIDVQSDIIGELNTRLVIPLFPVNKLTSQPVLRLTPVVVIEGEEYLAMTHEMASVRLSQLGEEVTHARHYRQSIKNALDFIFDGF